jgi:hypothetical protein
LLDGLPTTGANIFKARLYPLTKAELPGLCIYTNSEEADLETGKFDIFDRRTLTVSVEGYSKLTAGIDDELDDIASEVEDALLVDEAISSAKTVDLVSVEYGKSAESDQKVGMVKMDYAVTYMINRGDSETAL